MERKFFKSVFLTLVISLFSIMLMTPVTADAAEESAASLKELAVIVNRHGVNRDNKFTVRYTGPDEDIDYLLDENLYFFYKDIVLADDPNTSDDADYVSGNLDFSSTGWNLYYEDGYITFKLTYFETKAQSDYVNSQVPGILKQLGVAGMSNYEKVKTIHDYVCGQITYDDSNTAVVSTMYGAIKNGKALCNSYALCMYKLLVEAGVPCKYIGGKAGTGRDSGGHAWNIVALGDKWYYVDATWDDEDKKGVDCYDYFLKGSSDFDEVEPDQVHKSDKAYTAKDFTSAFPIAKKSFDPYTMDDENTLIKIGDKEYKGKNEKTEEDASGSDRKDDPDEKNTNTKTYKWNDIVEEYDPASGTFSVKKGNAYDLYLSFYKSTGNLIKSVKYKIKSGKNCIKYIDNFGIEKDKDGRFCFMEIMGKKKGKVKIQVIITLKDGQKVTRTFTGKIKA